MKLLEVASHRAESAEYRVNEILAEYRDQAVVPGGKPIPGYEAIHRLVTVSEMYAGEHLVDVTEARLPHDDLVQRLWDRRIQQIVRDWPGRRAGWKDLFQLPWDYPDKEELEGWILVRNIAAHGLGTLTTAQLRRGSVKEHVNEALSRVGVPLHGRELAIDADAVERCATRIKDFVTWLDRAAFTAVGAPQIR